ncbi:unnamed protein product [Rhizophagus irregularis]|nr:unnamed protein product [Rhizophagus irregularis]CAB4478007.1 unnamed protein product [Rhizophagus irregularis]CAB5186811.1 unnamed protein product [Rhizophagus irregularis]
MDQHCYFERPLSNFEDGGTYMTSNTNDPQNQPTIDPYAAPGMATNNSVKNNTFEPLKGKGEYERERGI